MLLYKNIKIYWIKKCIRFWYIRVVEPKNPKGTNKNVVATISRSKCKIISLNSKYFGHSMNRTENSNPKIRNYEINKISSSYFDDKI